MQVHFKLLIYKYIVQNNYFGMNCVGCGSEFNHMDSTMDKCGYCRTFETDAERHERHKAERANPRLKKLRKNDKNPLSS